MTHRGRILLFVNRRAPHGTIHAHEALEAVLMGTAFERPVWVAFCDDGVFQLCRSQDTGDLGLKNFSATYRALEMYGVERVIVEGDSLLLRGLGPDDLLIDVEVLDGAALGEVMDRADVVFSF